MRKARNGEVPQKCKVSQNSKHYTTRGLHHDGYFFQLNQSILVPQEKSIGVESGRRGGRFMSPIPQINLRHARSAIHILLEIISLIMAGKILQFGHQEIV